MPLPVAVEAAFATPNGNYNLVLEATHNLIYRAAPVNEPGPDDVVIKMSRVGICGRLVERMQLARDKVETSPSRWSPAFPSATHALVDFQRHAYVARLHTGRVSSRNGS